MDVQMPELDGIEATKKIREIELKNNIYTPIVALTAGAVKEERDKCFLAGMDDFLTKPIDSVKLAETLQKYLNIEKEESIIDSDISDKFDNLPNFEKDKLMQRIGDNRFLFQKLVEISSRTYGGYIDELLLYMDEGKNTLEIKKCAHKVKGAALNICFTKLAVITRYIEENIETDIDKVLSLKSAVVSEWEILKTIIKKLHDELKTN